MSMRGSRKKHGRIGLIYDEQFLNFVLNNICSYTFRLTQTVVQLYIFLVYLILPNLFIYQPF